MKTLISLLTIFLLISSITTSNAQRKDCIICPEMLGIITSTENGVNISTLTPNQNSTLIVSSESQKAQKATKPSANRKKMEEVSPRIHPQNQTLEEKEDEIMGFATVGMSEEDCDCIGSNGNEEKTTKEDIEVFTLYPNPAHHWVVINSKIAEGETYKLFLKDAQGVIIKERDVLSGETTKLDLRALKHGVYFITLRNEKDFSTTVKKFTVN
jgi:hypothetical protein